MNRVIHKMYIPEGVWYDIFTGKKYNGGKRYTAFYKDEEYPLLVRAGTIIPFSLNFSINYSRIFHNDDTRCCIRIKY